MKTTSLFRLLLCCALFGACKEAAKSPEPDTPPTTGSSYESRYYHLVGTVGDLPVTFNLTTSRARYEDGAYFGGYYYYDRYQQPINLYGSIDSAGQLVLMEQSGLDGEPNNFRGEWTEDGHYRGEWSTGDGSRTLNFDLRPAEAGSTLAFELHHLHDSVVAMPSWSQSPVATYQIDWLSPGMQDQALRTFLQQAILSGLVGDSLAGVYGSIEKAVGREKQVYFDDYRSEFSDMFREGQIDTTEEAYSFNYEVSQSMDVLYNSPKLLTLGYNYYMYAGGAHGNYSTTAASYDLTNRRKLKLTDVLKPGYESTLGPALAQAVRDRYNIGKDEALTEVLFEEEITPNENFGITPKGILFFYPPYEIAPYAAGQIELFIPFDSIREQVQPEVLRFGEENS